MTRSCYNCQHQRLCHFERSVHDAIDSNLHMVDTNQQVKSPSSFIRIFETLATVCIQFKEVP